MQEKIVDYKLCQRLAELKFECESHTGWWQEYEGQWFYLRGQDDVSVDVPSSNFYKAFDCWDLLMWAHRNRSDVSKIAYLSIPNALETKFTTGTVINECWISVDLAEMRDKEPQNALAKAIIKILEERQ